MADLVMPRKITAQGHHSAADMAAIFPIIRRSPRTNQEEFCGTGFLISRFGHFLSAYHIIEAFPQDPYFVGLDPSNLLKQNPIRIIAGKAAAEILLGQVEPSGEQPLQFSHSLPQLGSALQIRGYSGNRVLKDPVGLYFYKKLHLHSYMSRYLEHVGEFQFPVIERDGRKFSPKRFSVITSDGAAPSGVSGGPVTDTTGRLIGLHSMVQTLEDYNGGNPIMLHVSLEALCEFVCRGAPEIAETIVPSKLRPR